MGQAQRWILLANQFDSSHFRNKAVFDFAEAAGLSYSPDSQWVDLYLNGEYAGLYLLCERNEVHPQRVSIPEEGSFLVSMELEKRLSEQGYPYVSTQSGITLRIHHASVDTDTLAQVLQSAENAILAEDGIDPVTGKPFTELIDLDSWAKKFLIEEIFGNLDAGLFSQFFYLDGSDKSGKIYAGPAWDYDDSTGNATYPTYVPYAILASRQHLLTEEDAPWFSALYQSELFYDRVVELYQTVFLPLLENLLDTGIGQYAAQISQSAAMNQILWPDQERDTPAETEHILSYMTSRMAFLNSLWLENEEYCIVQVNVGDGNSFACYAIRPGEYLPSLPEYENTATTTYHGWYTSDTDEPFDITQPIYESTMIYQKRTSVPSAQEPVSNNPVQEPVSSEQEPPSARQFAPLLLLLMMLLCLFLVDKIRAKRDDTQKNG